MKHNKKYHNQCVRAKHQDNNTTTTKPLVLGNDRRPSPINHTELRPESHAGPAVFNAPELLEAILVNLTVESLTRALVLSRYCRSVILGCRELRRNLFLEPSPATEFVEVDNRQLLRHPNAHRQIINQPNQNSHMIVTAHLLLVSLRDNFAFCAHSCQERPPGAAYGIMDGTMHMVSPSTLLFQPPPPKVRVFYRGHYLVLERDEGVTFRDVAEGLQDLRIRCQDIVDELVKQPCTPWNRYRYAKAMEALGGPSHSHTWCASRHEWHIPAPESCVFLAAEGAISEDSRHVWMARRGMNFTGW